MNSLLSECIGPQTLFSCRWSARTGSGRRGLIHAGTRASWQKPVSVTKLVGPTIARRPQGWGMRAQTDGKEVVVTETSSAVVAEEGDMISVHYRCKADNGAILDSSEGREPLTFEVGAGRFLGNPLFKSFDEATVGLAVGQSQTVKSLATEWNEELVFEVARQHEEVLRLEKVAESLGEELKPGSVVELVNGELAIILSMNEETVTINANHPLAGRTLDFEVEVVSIEKASERSDK